MKKIQKFTGSYIGLFVVSVLFVVIVFSLGVSAGQVTFSSSERAIRKGVVDTSRDGALWAHLLTYFSRSGAKDVMTAPVQEVPRTIVVTTLSMPAPTVGTIMPVATSSLVEIETAYNELRAAAASSSKITASKPKGATTAKKQKTLKATSTIASAVQTPDAMHKLNTPKTVYPQSVSQTNPVVAFIPLSTTSIPAAAFATAPQSSAPAASTPNPAPTPAPTVATASSTSPASSASSTGSLSNTVTQVAAAATGPSKSRGKSKTATTTTATSTTGSITTATSSPSTTSSTTTTKISTATTTTATTSSSTIATQTTTSSTTASVATSTISTSTLAVATTAPIVVSSSPVSAPTAPAGNNYGIAAGGGLTGLNQTDLDAYFTQLKSLGVSWVRWDVDWGIVQAGGPTSYNWAGVDRVAATAAKFGIKSLPIITYAPQWAFDPVFKCASYQHCEPLDPNAFARFAGEVVKRYKDSIHVWEIWNEQNLSVFWAPRSNCQKYTALLKASYTAIKQVDPSATVLAGGFAPAATDGTNMAPIDYLKCIYAEGGKGYFDAVAHHPYTYPYSPSTPGGNAWAQMSLTSTSLRSLMVLNGDGDKKIWMTEFGAPTGGPDSRWYVSEAMQASIIKEALQLHATYPWAGPIFIYSLRDSGTTSETNENFFGIMRRDWTRKPAYDTMKTIISSGI